MARIITEVMPLYYKYRDTTCYIPFMFISIIFSYYIFNKYNEGEKWLAILFVSFFLCTFLLLKKEFLLSAIIFFILGLVINSIYYNVEPLESYEIRIKKISSYEVIGSINNRLVYLDNELEGVNVGDRIIAKGEYKKQIDVDKGIVGIIYINNYKFLKDDIITKICNIRPYIYEKMKVKLGARRAALVSSMAFGYTEYLDSGDKEDMRDLGVLHAISVSGMHLALIYYLLRRFLGNRNALIISLVYVILTGAVSSTIRAYLMVLTANLALPLKRNYNGVSALTLAGIIILIVKPYAVYSVGFWLSFTATLGIILYNSKINKKLYKLHKIFRETISISLASQIFSFPVLAATFYEFSFNFILGNLLLAPFITIIVLLGNIAIIFSFIEPVFNYICFLLFYVTYGLDKIISLYENVKIPMLIMNENTYLIYISCLIGFYFVYKGHKKMIIVPICAFLSIWLCMYSSNINVKYYKEGAFLIKYKWERILFVTNKNADIERLYKITIANKISKDRTLHIEDNIYLELKDKNSYIQIYNNRYFLKTRRGNFYSKYDIIDFSNDKNSNLTINKDNMITID